MEPKELIPTLSELLSKQLSDYFSELEAFATSSGYSGQLVKYFFNSAFSNGYIDGHIEFLPHNDPNEEEIVLTISVRIGTPSKTVDLGIDISWCDGETIKMFIDKNDIGFDVAVQEIDLLVEQSNKAVISEMKKQISMDRPPRYRKPIQ